MLYRREESRDSRLAHALVHLDIIPRKDTLELTRGQLQDPFLPRLGRDLTVDLVQASLRDDGLLLDLLQDLLCKGTPISRSSRCRNWSCRRGRGEGADLVQGVVG